MVEEASLRCRTVKWVVEEGMRETGYRDLELLHQHRLTPGQASDQQVLNLE